MLQLVVYVGDFIAAGHKSQLPNVWAELESLFLMEPAGPLSRFLGVRRKISKHKASERGNIVHKMTSPQVEYAKSIVEMCREHIGMDKSRKLRHVATPMDSESLASVQNPHDEGEFKESAPKYVGKLLYLCRMSRPDLQTAICRLSRHLHKWSRYADHMLHRIF